MTSVIAIRFGEIFLKGGNRPYFMHKLVEAIKRATADLGAVKIHRIYGRLLVEVGDADLGRAADRIAKVFGVQNLSPARVVPADLAAITAEAIRFAREGAAAFPGGRPRFKVQTRRSMKEFPLNSIEVSQQVGGLVHQATGLPVDVHEPQLTVGVEIGRERSFVYGQTLPGPGGLPVGATGPVNLLLSGGIDSPVAGWLAMKRGCTIDATYFHSFPYTGDKTREKVVDVVRLLTTWHGPIHLHVVPFTAVQKALRKAGPAELAVVLYRRMMMRAAAEIAHRRGHLALVTGENLAQVASQTLENLAVIEEASFLPVLRPLLTNDKLETVKLAKRIGTYETSIQPYEDCCSLFVPSHPATKARLNEVHVAESKLDVKAMAIELADTTERIQILMRFGLVAVAVVLAVVACHPVRPVTIAPPPPIPVVPKSSFQLIAPPGGAGATALPVVAARVFALGDSQLHWLYGKRTFAQSPFADRYQGIEVAIRPAALDDGGDLLLQQFLDERRARWQTASMVYMGDAADLSCEQEYDRFFGLLARAGESPLLMVTSNHDGFYVGNFTQKADAGGQLRFTDMPVDWGRACSMPGSLEDHILTKGRAVARIAEKLPEAPDWATFFAAGDPDDPSGYTGAHLYYARPLGGGDAGAPPVWGLFLDTVDYRDFDLLAAKGAGTVGSISQQQLVDLDHAMYEAAIAVGPNTKISWITFGHHPLAGLDEGARERFTRFLDARPEIVGVISAHTHISDERTVALPSGRRLPELVVGSTTDYGGVGVPEEGRIIEVRAAGAERGLASWRLQLDVPRICADVPPIPAGDPMGYTSYRLERDDTPDVPTSNWSLFWAWLGDNDLGHWRVAQTAGALLVQNRLVRALAYIYEHAPGGVANDGARAELKAVMQRRSAVPAVGPVSEYDAWWDPILKPWIPDLARTLLSFGAEMGLFDELRETRAADLARRHWFMCQAARAAEEEVTHPRKLGNVTVIR